MSECNLESKYKAARIRTAQAAPEAPKEEVDAGILHDFGKEPHVRLRKSMKRLLWVLGSSAEKTKVFAAKEI